MPPVLYGADVFLHVLTMSRLRATGGNGDRVACADGQCQSPENWSSVFQTLWADLLARRSFILALFSTHGVRPSRNAAMF